MGCFSACDSESESRVPVLLPGRSWNPAYPHVHGLSDQYSNCPETYVSAVSRSSDAVSVPDFRRAHGHCRLFRPATPAADQDSAEHSLLPDGMHQEFFRRTETSLFFRRHHPRCRLRRHRSDPPSRSARSSFHRKDCPDLHPRSPFLSECRQPV